MPIEALRVLAVFLLVAYHVIGAGPDAGLNIEYPHPLRLFAEFLVDARMPLFAFVAGFVYAFRPPVLADYGGFLTGKIRRLIIPGWIAALLFSVAGMVVGNVYSLTVQGPVRVLFHHYAHYWFLQSIMVIFVVFGLVDALLRHRHTALLFLAAVAMTLAGITLRTSFLSIDGAFYLLPYFLFGTLCHRHADQLLRHRIWLAALALGAIFAAGWWNIGLYLETGRLSGYRGDLQSLGFGLGIALAMLLLMPRIGWLDALRPFSFTIYLYHVLATSATRRALLALDVTDVWVLFGCGLSTGLLVPVLLHLVIDRIPALRHPVLGLRRNRRPKPAAARPGFDPQS
ncbi:acyltransferase family protein [Rhodovulum sulfidophilum]|uniref:acyltransferase family protein n=1 Tax=Rhodovulum sulfidophilum TaxID=35806 RepID=UPI001924074C|nr:acyltransferase [Rhodovulum sulfidophilum]MBL3560141.1 acyltransferase [Rhodovulum sulfidophilum]